MTCLSAFLCSSSSLAYSLGCHHIVHSQPCAQEILIVYTGDPASLESNKAVDSFLYISFRVSPGGFLHLEHLLWSIYLQSDSI